MKHYLYITILLLFILSSCLGDPDVEYEKANKSRDTINKYNLDEFAEDEYNTAEENYGEAKTLIEAEKKNFKLNKYLTEANKNYDSVIEKGFPPYTDKKDESTKEKKSDAKDIKADVAVKDQFEEAQKAYEEALLLKEEKKYEEAIEKFEAAQELFKQAYSDAKFKKDRANKSINSTEESINEVKNRAKEFDKTDAAN